MKRNNAMRKKLIAFAILITMLCNNSAVPAWAATEEETQVVSTSENNEPLMDIPDDQEEQTEAGETTTGTESTDSDMEQPEAADQGIDSSTDQSEAPQKDIPEVSTEEVIEIEDYIREKYGEEYVPLMNERLEPDELPGFKNLEESNGSSTEFVVDLALAANEHWWQNQDSFDAFRNNGYEFDGSDINSGSGMSSKYIYLGWKYTNDIQANIGSVITGILIKIGKRVDYFEYNNKKYYPLSRQFRDSNFDLNQGAGGDFLYIYYTRDGAEKGDPVICTSNFGISTGRPGSGLLADGIDDNGSITKDMNINPKGDATYLTYDYHTHTLKITPYEDGHTSKCNTCNFHSALLQHEYEYVSISDSQHEGTCKACKHKIRAPHMDSNNDLKCDDCQIPVEAYISKEVSGESTQTGAYKTFTAAWNDAVANKTDCSINLLKNISLTHDNIEQGAQHLPPIENGKTITIQTHVDEKKETEPKPKAKLTIDGDTFKNFSEVFYVRNGGLIIKTDIIIDGGVSFNSVITESSNAARLEMDEEATIHVKGRLNKDLSLITADQSALFKAPKVNLEFSGSRGSKPYSIYGIHVMNGSTADIALATINDFDQAFRVNNAKLVIHGGHYQDKTVVYVEKPGDNSEILILGGEFTGTDGYCLDSRGAKVSIELGKFTGSLRVGENQKISSVLALGRCAAEIDAEDKITRRIPLADLNEAGNRITFEKLTKIIVCKVHDTSEAKYYSRKTHKGFCDFCGQEELFDHIYDDGGCCKVCKTNQEIVLITSAGIYEYYNCLEDAVMNIGVRTDVIIKPTRDIEATDAFLIYEGREEGERKRLTIDLNGFTMTLHDTGVTQVLEGYDLTVQNGKLQIWGKGLTLKNSKLTIDSCTIISYSLVLIDSNFNIGKNGVMDGTPGLSGDSILQLTDNGTITADGTLTVHNGQQVIMSDKSTFVLRENRHESAIMVQKGGSLILSDEALIDDISEESSMAIHYEEGAIISFAGGGVRKDFWTALTPNKWLSTRVSEFLVPGYAYYKYESGNELTEEAIADNEIRDSFIVRPHKDHTYKYFDMGDGTHQAVCALCKITGPTSPHVGQKDSNLCTKCNVSFVCTHEFNDDGICKYCSLTAEACVIIDDEKTFYVAYEDAWKQVKGKKATIRALKKLSRELYQTLIIEDRDDITIENGEFHYVSEDNTIIVNGGKLTINSGIFLGRHNSQWTLIVNRGEVIINGGKIAGYNGIQANGGTITIADGSFDTLYPGLVVRKGSVIVKGGVFESAPGEHCIEVMKSMNVKDLLPTGYYYADPDKNIPTKINEDKPWYIQFRTAVKQHMDHTGYWKDGVCSLCKYECTHPSFEGSRCAVCGVEIESQLFVVYKEGDDSKRESFDHLQDALNFACQHPGSELIVSKDIPADATDKTSYTVPEEGLSVDPPIDFTIQLGKHTIGTQLFIKKARVNIKGDDGGISVSSGSALHIGVDADVRVENCNFHTDDSKLAAISIKDSKTAYLKNVHANGGYAVDASDVKDTVTLEGGYYCTASGDKESALQAVAFTGTSGKIKGCTITATAEDAAALYLYRCSVVIDDTRLLIDDAAKEANSIRLPRRGSSETELIIENGSGIYEMASGKNITDDYSDKGKISASVDKSVYIGKAFPEKQAQIIGYEPLADIEFPAGTAIDDIIAKIPTEANAVTLNYPDKKVKVKVAFDKEEIRKAIQKVYDQEIKTLTRGENRVRTKKIDIYAKGIVSGWPEDISVVLEKTLNLRLCVEVRKYSVTLNDGQTKQEYFTGDVVELHVDDHTHGKVFSHWDVVEGEVNLDISLPDTSFIMPPVNLVINAVYEDQLELVPEKAATCTKTGNKAYYICDCGQWFQSPEDAKADKPIADHSEVVIPATGHVDKDADGHCDVCREKISNKNNGGGGDSRTNGGTVSNRNSGIFTGDQSNLIIWFILLTGSSLVLCVLIRKRRSR